MFVASRVVVFVDGCFWHGCPEHASWPKNNAAFWKRKIESNRQRDTETTERLSALGWKVIRVWEHDEPELAADRIAQVVREHSYVA